MAQRIGKNLAVTGPNAAFHGGSRKSVGWHGRGTERDAAPGGDWDPVDELALIQAEIDRLRARHAALCDMFLTAGAAVRFEGSTHVVEVVAESRRSFDRRRLPPAILMDERFYAVSTCRNVRLVAKPADGDDAAVIEPFH